ncbi:MAG: hypothetical protein ACO2O2_00265, partial [Acidilobaceae archaeon]
MSEITKSIEIAKIMGTVAPPRSRARGGELESLVKVELKKLLRAIVEASLAEGVGLEQLAR